MLQFYLMYPAYSAIHAATSFTPQSLCPMLRYLVNHAHPPRPPMPHPRPSPLRYVGTHSPRVGTGAPWRSRRLGRVVFLHISISAIYYKQQIEYLPNFYIRSKTYQLRMLRTMRFHGCVEDIIVCDRLRYLLRLGTVVRSRGGWSRRWIFGL